MWPGSGWTRLTDSGECGEASRKQHNEEARPITQPLPFIHSVFSFFNLRSAFLSLSHSHTLCPLLLLSLFSHFLDRRSKYPRAVNSNRSFNDSSRHWQVLSPRATIVRDVRRDKIGATNSAIENEHNSEEAGRQAGRQPQGRLVVRHCHLVLDVSAGFLPTDAACSHSQCRSGRSQPHDCVTARDAPFFASCTLQVCVHTEPLTVPLRFVQVQNTFRVHLKDILDNRNLEHVHL